MAPYEYPGIERDESVVDTQHGVDVPDPYRALEDPNAPCTKAFCEAQNQVTQDFLKQASGLRDKVKGEITDLYDYDRFGAPSKHGDAYYYFHHKGLANQAVLMRSRSIDAEDAEVLIDPNTLSEDGTASLGTIEFSEDGKYLAYGINRSGSDWADIRVMETETKRVLPEVLEWAKFYSIAWTHDNKGFYYTRYPKPASLDAEGAGSERRGEETDQTRDQAIYYHEVGCPQDRDRFVFTDVDNPSYIYGAQITDDGKYLLIQIHEDCAPRNLLWFINLSKHFGHEADHLVKFINEFEAEFSYVTNDDSKFYLCSNLNAPRRKLVSVEVTDQPSCAADRAMWPAVVAEDETKVMVSITPVNNSQMAIVYMKDVCMQLSIHTLSTGNKLYDIPLPDLGNVMVAGERKDEFLFFKFTSFLYPGTIFFCDLTLPVGDGLREYRKATPPGFDASLYRTRQVFYSSKDGTKIPMFIIEPQSQQSAETDAKPPCLLYGYGGFSISLSPSYSIRIVSWLKCLGGVVAIANIRGGGEYGEEWHEDGILAKKQNGFDDFQYAAKAIAGPEVNLTSSDKILIMGGSNGGLLVGACINQAPELFGAAVAQVGVLDMLRFPKFTIGSAWVSDFGDPAKPEDFQTLLKYSPLHNTFSPAERQTAYPAVMLTTGSHDDRVVPLHSLKHVATLQHRVSEKASEAVQGDRPILLRVDIKAGHGAGKPTTKIVDEMADTFTFAALTLKLDNVV